MTHVTQQPNGDYHVAVEVLDQPEANGVMTWPARPDNPAAALRIGDSLTLAPTPAGAGWVLHDKEGDALAFVPTPDASHDLMQESL
ncbi:hypothetical protein DBR33_02780 [Stenotrophomonas sp. HMWF022]|nr:hypothetical protein DBR20_07405 [Stenotrophomonas sp. HMWF023]PTT56140.1 hypothetical protein DBR33_02780 [Stenotrophomonas sp. HMWF022]